MKAKKAAGKTEARKTARDILAQLEHFDKNFTKIWSGRDLNSRERDTYKHQQEGLESTLLRRQELAQQLHTAFWESPVSRTSTMSVEQARVEIDRLKSFGHISTKQARMMYAAIDKTEKGFTPVRAKQRPSVDPQTYRGILIKALGATEEESKQIHNWNYPTVRKILGLGDIKD